MSLVNSTKKYDDNEQEEHGNGSNIDVHISDTEEMTRIPEITSEELQDAIRKLKEKVNHQTATGFEQKTSKLVTRRRKKWCETNLQRNQKTKRIHA